MYEGQTGVFLGHFVTVISFGAQVALENLWNEKRMAFVACEARAAAERPLNSLSSSLVE